MAEYELGRTRIFINVWANTQMTNWAEVADLSHCFSFESVLVSFEFKIDCFKCWYKSEEKFWTHWIPESRQFFLQFYYKIDKGDMRAGKVTRRKLHLVVILLTLFRDHTQTCQRRWINLRLPHFAGSLPFPSLVSRETSKHCQLLFQMISYRM